ncbi:LacI family DNA-binding transcriptional regulator [Arthrobacter sp. B2a2-09]|uniref:LacI family DNA-binding transcriptional regulator n=1 Tax=Arthrobacter sp. B2a2-09 TaxID=2952822 RepID=UPI0022CD3D81|nr:LacI family DNA-binding transcriptional regulator [Arthrobacter sp. B2a2-09]MCZ9880605.1 LacI family transcriptional regulator [Arthrobacter sp. B2a2-09]
MRVTSSDVARASGVSRTTVSFVLNNTPSHTIPTATRERVLHAARELGYVPSTAGLALAKGRTDIALLNLGSVPLSEYQAGLFAAAFSNRLAEAGATVVVHGSGGSDKAALLRLVRATQPFAVVSFAEDLNDVEKQMRNSGVQLIEGIDFNTGRSEIFWMKEAAELQLRHLHERGHRHVSFVHTERPELREMSEQKAAIAEQCAGTMGIEFTSPLAVGVDRESTSQTIKQWREQNPQASAIICFNDDVALAMLGSLRDNGIQVPSEIAVIGTDDIPLAQYAIPGVTTLRVDTALGATRVATSLLRAMGQKIPLQEFSHVFTLVVRGTT